MDSSKPLRNQKNLTSFLTAVITLQNAQCFCICEKVHLLIKRNCSLRHMQREIMLTRFQQSRAVRNE